MRTIEKVTVIVDGMTIEVEKLEDGSFRRPDWLRAALREKKQIPYTGEAMLRLGGDNTRPWIEAALKKGYHELAGDEPATPEAVAWDGWGTALKPAWEPVVVGRKPL